MLLRDLRDRIRRRAAELGLSVASFRNPEVLPARGVAIRRQDFAPAVPPAPELETVDFLRIARGRRVTLWGMAQTPGNGLLHAVWGEAEPLQEGIEAGPDVRHVNARLRHAYSADGGRTWAVQDALAAVPFAEARRVVVAGGDRRLHLFVVSALQPRTPLLPASDVVVTNPHVGPGGTFSVALWYQYVRGGMPAGGYKWSRYEGTTGGQSGNAGTTVQVTVRRSREPGVDGIRLLNIGLGVTGEEYEYYEDAVLLRELPNATATVILGEADFLNSPLTTTGTVYRYADRAAVVHARTAEDGRAWQAPQTVDLDRVPDDVGQPPTVNPNPPPAILITAVDRRFGLPASEGGEVGNTYGQPAEENPGMALCVDDAGGLLFLYRFDGKDHVDTGAPSNQVLDAELEAVYWKDGASDPRAHIVRLAGGPAVGTNIIPPLEAWRHAGTAAALWARSLAANRRDYATRVGGGAWSSVQTFFQDTGTEFMGRVRLHPAPGRLVALAARFVTGQNRQRVDRRELALFTLAWGPFVQLGGAIPTTLLTRDGLSGSSYLTERLRWFLSGAEGAASELWYGRSEEPGEERRIFAEGAQPPSVSPALADARVADGPRTVSGRTVYALLGGTPTDDADATDIYAVRVRNAR